MNQMQVRIEVKLVFLVMFLVALAIWTYQGSTGNGFVWDSKHYLLVYENHFAHLNWENIKWMATSLEFYNWHPLTWLSWAIDYQLYGGLDPWGYHFTNNLLHACNGVLVFVLILTVFGIADSATKKFTIAEDNHSLIAAFLASALFVVHPQHVESVAWVAERKDLLVQLFLLLSLLAYVKYVTCNQLIKTRWYLITLGLFFLAVLSKPMAVTFPVVLLLIDVYPLRRSSLAKPIISSVRQQSLHSLFVEKIPFFLLSLALVLITLMAQRTAVVDMSLIQRIFNAVHSIVLYLEKFVLPLSLNPHYPYFKVLESSSALIALVVFSIFSGITLAAMFAWRKQKRAWMIVWLLYLVTLSPVLGLIQVGSQGAADRYAYFPTLPIYVLLAGGILVVMQSGKTFRKNLLLTVATIVILLFLFLTRQQVGVWQSELSLWTHALKINPSNISVRNNLGITYMNISDYKKAAIHFEAGGEEPSGPSSMLAWRAVTYMHLGRYKESVLDLVKLGMTADIRPELIVDSNCIQYDIGWNYAQLKMYQESIDLFRRVDSKSHSGSDAGLWLDELSMIKSLEENTVLSEDLPGFCENLIPSRVRGRRVGK